MQEEIPHVELHHEVELIVERLEEKFRDFDLTTFQDIVHKSAHHLGMHPFKPSCRYWLRSALATNYEPGAANPTDSRLARSLLVKHLSVGPFGGEGAVKRSTSRFAVGSGGGCDRDSQGRAWHIGSGKVIHTGIGSKEQGCLARPPSLNTGGQQQGSAAHIDAHRDDQPSDLSGTRPKVLRQTLINIRGLLRLRQKPPQAA